MAAKSANAIDITFRSAFEADDSLRQYGSNALSIFALSLYLRIENIEEFAANAITEGGDDKKVDICHLDEAERRAVIAQSYLSERWDREVAPSNKASDLHSAIGWLFSVSEDLIPERLRAKVLELRQALGNGDITKIEILFIHNCPESSNVERELKAAADLARDAGRALAGQYGEALETSSRELGLHTIEELYRSRDSDILVDEMMDVPITNYVPEEGQGWSAILTTVSADWIRALHRRHGDRLFSANYRDYLGYARRSGNINYEIKRTAESEPENFWVYNNGITALTYQLCLDQEPIQIRGISIINGAQTTGALSDARESTPTTAKVLIRIVQCDTVDLVNNIIQYNNTQNEIKPADRRSRDAIQLRLAADLHQYGIPYIHRRSAPRAPRKAISAEAIAPVLCAFHGDPQTAFRSRKEIFMDDDVYKVVFRGDIRVEHIFMLRALSAAFDSVKSELKKKVADDTATDIQQKEYKVLSYSAAKHFVCYVVGVLAEEILDQRVSDLHEWKCTPEVVSVDNRSMSRAWEEVLHALLPLLASEMEQGQYGDNPFYEVPRRKSLSQQVARRVKASVASIGPQLGNRFAGVRSRTTA